MHRDIRKRAREKARRQAEAYLDQLSPFEQAGLIRYQSEAVLRLGIPKYNWWNEALHGVARAGTATVFPVPVGLAATFHEALIKQVGDVISTEGRAKYNACSQEDDYGIYKGLTFWSPNINIYRDPRWGRGYETFGEDPYLTAIMGAAFIMGIQGEDKKFLKAAACVKHFAVHSGPEALRHEFDAKVGQKDLWETYLPAFEHCVRNAHVEGAMGGYSSLNGLPLCGNPYLIQDVLREKWGFEGYYVSDCWAIRDFHEHHKVTGNPAESAAMALNAGCDVNCGSCYAHIISALHQGLITGETLRGACKRALTTRLLLGMEEKTPWDHYTYEDVDTPDAQRLNYQAAVESVVLLKNDGILPIDGSKSLKIGVIGPNADSYIALQGNYHGTASHYITVLEGIKQAAGEQIRILYSSGCEVMEDRAERLAEKNDRIAEAKSIAKLSDVVILCVGLDERYEGEAHHISTGECIGGDRTDILLPEPQRILVEAVLSGRTPVILCCMTGGAIDLSEYESRASAVLQAWYGGAMGGLAVADILFGKRAPSGKLPITFYGRDYVIPDFKDYSMKNRTYRYVEDGVLYPFGFGLTYGMVVMKDAWWNPDNQSVICTIENVSKRELAETVQIYKKNPESSLEVRNCALCGFLKVTVKPGETKTVAVPVWEWTFTVVDENGRRKADAKTYLLWAGTHGPDEKNRTLTGTDVISMEVKLPSKLKEEKEEKL